jgi:hypothetical protein
MKIKLLLITVLFCTQVYSQFTGYEFSTGITTQLNSVSNSRPNFNGCRGWSCGVNGTIIKSQISPSAQWINLSGHGVPTNINLTNINATDTLNAFVCGTLNSVTYVWKTSNGGNNWSLVFNQQNGFINAVWMKNSLMGFMEGNPVNGRWSLWKTTNGGISWDSTGLFLPQSGNENGWPNSFFMIMTLSPPNYDTNKIWFGTNNYHIYYTSNYGQNWSAQNTSPEQNSFCIGVWYSLIIAGGSNYVLSSTNYGTNWITTSIGGSGNIVGISPCAWSTYLVRGNSIYQRISSNWNLFYTAPSGNYIYCDNKCSGNGLDHYAVRSNGGITSLFEIEGVKKIGNYIPKSFSLSQNYPNPFNPTTNINYQLPNTGFVKLTVFDALGREVAVLVNEQQTPGTYQIDWDASDYPSGVYFYKITSGDFSENKKMVLIK